MKIKAIGHLMKTNPIQTQFKANPYSYRGERREKAAKDGLRSASFAHAV
jgi:hypothetical protein